jgi:MFS family permease
MATVIDNPGWSATTARRERGMQLLLLALAITAAVYAKRALSPLQETMRVVLALSDHDMALLQGPALALPMLLAAIPIGLIVDRYSRTRLLQILCALIVLGTLLSACAPSFRVLFIGRSIVGLAAFAMAPAALSLIADLYASAQRGRANMVITVGQFAGGGAVFALGGMLVTMGGSAPTAWRSAMLWLSVPLVAVALALFAMREPPRSDRVSAHPSLRDSFRSLWQHRAKITPPLLGIVMAEIMLQSVMIWTAPALVRRFALTPDRVGAVMGLAVPLGGILGTIAGGLVADWCQRTGGPRRTLGVLCVLAMLCAPAGLFASVSQLVWAGVLFTLLLALLNMTLVIGLTLFAIIVPNELRGLSAAILTGLGVLLAVGLAPLLVSRVAEGTNGPGGLGSALLLLCLGAGFAAAVAFACGRFGFTPTTPRPKREQAT